jgi:hypothetical protein
VEVVVEQLVDLVQVEMEEMDLDKQYQTPPARPAVVVAMVVVPQAVMQQRVQQG